MSGSLLHLQLLLRLLDVARAGALFPDPRGVKEWVALLSRPWAGRTAPKPELHEGSGLPTARSLHRLLQRQRLARAFFQAHRTRPPRASDQFNVALAAAHLFSPGTEVKLMTAARGTARLLVVHDRFEPGGTLVRISAQLTQAGHRHVKVERGTHAVPEPRFTQAVELGCERGVTAAALGFASLQGLTVHEVVRAELGPCLTAQAGALASLKAGGEEGALSLVLERVGETVSRDHCADAWPADDHHAAARAARGWRLSRERRLACTTGLEPGLKALAAPSRMLVRSR